jgi:hypothetical protein
MANRKAREEILRPLLSALEGKPIPHAELLRTARLIACVLVDHGRPLSLTVDGPWAGVWDLQRLTDDEAVAWGMWVATKVRHA